MRFKTECMQHLRRCAARGGQRARGVTQPTPLSLRVRNLISLVGNTAGIHRDRTFYKFQRDYKRLNPEMVLYVLYKGYCLVRENMLHWCWTAGALMCPASEGKRRTERKAATKFDAIQ